jgi:hypothetical protein
MCSEELHQKSSERSVVQSDWLPKCHMEMGNDSSAAKDFSSQKKVITTNDFAPAVVSRHKIQAWRVAIWLYFGSRGRRMCFRGVKGFSMSALLQSLQSKATRLPDPPQPINLVLFPGNAGKETSKSRISATDANVTAPDSPLNSDFRSQGSNRRASPKRAQFQPFQTALNMMKSLASLILLATLTTMSGIRFAQGRGIIDRIAKEQGCARTMKELQLQQRQMSGKGSPEGLAY